MVLTSKEGTTGTKWNGQVFHSLRIFQIYSWIRKCLLTRGTFSAHCLPHVSALFYCAVHSPQGIMSMRRSDSRAGSALWSLCQKGTSLLHWTTATGNRKFSTLSFLSHCVCLVLPPLNPKVHNWVVAEYFHQVRSGRPALASWVSQLSSSCTSKLSWNFPLCLFLSVLKPV